MSTQPTATVTDLLVMGDARRRTLEARLDDRLRAWLREWSTESPAEIELTLIDPHNSHPARSPTFRHSAAARNADSPSLIAWATDDGMARALGLSRHVSLFDGSDPRLATELIEELLQSLVRTLLAGTKFQNCEVTPARSETVCPKRWWSISVGLDAHRADLLLLMPPELLTAYAPLSARTAATPVDGRKAMIASETARVEAILGEVQLTIGEIASLAVDDVVVLEQGLSEPAQLVTTSGSRIAKVSLGRLADRRAVSICR